MRARDGKKGLPCRIRLELKLSADNGLDNKGPTVPSSKISAAVDNIDIAKNIATSQQDLSSLLGSILDKLEFLMSIVDQAVEASLTTS